MKRKIQLGDVFEILTPRGCAYIQYVKYHDELGELVRVLLPVLEHRPERFDDIVADGERFITFFPLRYAQSRRIVEWVASEAVPERYETWPSMRAPGRVDPKTHRIETWWIWDGTQSTHVNELTHAEAQLSWKAIMNDTAIVDKIMSNWRPGDDLRS